MKYLLMLIMVALPVGIAPAMAQETAQETASCDQDIHRALDFWLGTWRVAWEGGEGTNTITKTHDGCVVQEDFQAPALHGMSISMFDRTSGKWRQTWMDNKGGYFSFYGVAAGEDYIFQTLPAADKPGVQMRMVFTDIQANSLTWRWQKTQDGGEIWEDMWTINYARMK